MANKITVTIGAVTSGFQKGLRSVKKSLMGLKKTARNVATSMRRGFRNVTIAVGGLVAAAGVAIKAAAKQEEAEKNLESVLKATGFAAGKTAKEIKDYASELEKTTKFGDEDILGGQAILATFKNISGPQFDRATKAMLDMSTVLKQDLKQGAIQLGKALNDPVQGITALSRVGVQFTEEQKALVKQLVETGDIVGAQNIIFKELEGQMGGAAEAARDTLGGSLAFLKNQFGTLLEAVGTGLAGGLDLTELFNKGGEAAANYADTLEKKVFEAAKKAKEFIQDIFAGGERREIAMQGLTDGIKSALQVAFDYAVAQFEAKAPDIGAAIFEGTKKAAGGMFKASMGAETNQGAWKEFGKKVFGATLPGALLMGSEHSAMKASVQKVQDVRVVDGGGDEQ